MYRSEEECCSRRVSMEEIEKNDFNLNISRNVSTAISEEIIDLQYGNKKLVAIEGKIADAAKRHNKFLKELGLPLI